MEEKHFFVVHTFVSDEARKEYLTPPEKRDPPQKPIRTEREWAERSNGQYARCMQEFYGNDEFFFSHWIAKSERDVYRQLEEFGLDGKYNSMVQELHRFTSAYRNSDAPRSDPEEGMYW